MKKAVSAIIMLCLLAAMMGGCGPDTNGLWHWECGGCDFTGCDYDGCYINGSRVCTDTAATDDFNSEVEACKQALADYADEMDTIAEELAQYGSVIIDIRKPCNGERFSVYSYILDEKLDESELSSETIAAIEALENSGRFTSFGVSGNENGIIDCWVDFYAHTPGYSTGAHRSSDKAMCSSFCEPLDDGWCLNMWPNV
ncbi:MAG: hypothetical protein E7554_00645 [Ruminococcaceae bacterium]|nr:hypothetical protein [Oscillospiraceae bacterium]